MALSLQRYAYPRRGLNRILKERSEKEQERSRVIAIKIGDHLPENLIIEILSWLPVKTLLQFKSVCKSWYAIITSPHFVYKHLKSYYKIGEHDCLLAQHFVSQGELLLFELLVDETSRVLSYEVLNYMPLDGSLVCGPCDGIYYVYDCLSYTVSRALWNPAINELKVLPPVITKPNLPSNMTYCSYEVYGFGFDPVSKDYKVILIKGYWNPSDEESEVWLPSSVLVYSLRTDSWRYWGDLAQDYFLSDNKCYVCANGVLYWLGSYLHDRNSEVILSFDMANDAIQEIPVPDYSKPAFKSLAIYNDSVAFLTVHEIEKCFDIWTSDEGFWTKIFSMGAVTDAWKPIGHWKNNKFLLDGVDDKILLCDPETQDVRCLAFRSDHGCHGVYAYRESLVSVEDRKVLGNHEESETVTDQV